MLTEKLQVVHLFYTNWNPNNTANGEPLVAREPLLILPVPGIMHKKVVIEDFCTLSCALYKGLYKYSFIYSILG